MYRVVHSQHNSYPLFTYKSTKRLEKIVFNLHFHFPPKADPLLSFILSAGFAKLWELLNEWRVSETSSSSAGETT